MTTMAATKDAYGTEIRTICSSPELRTSVQAGKDHGIATVTFNRIARRNRIVPMIVTGTEKAKYPVCVFTPDQVNRIVELAAQIAR